MRGSYAERGNDLAATFEDFRARLVLYSNGHAWGEGIRVRAPETELQRYVELGLLHPSLVEEPVSA